MLVVTAFVIPWSRGGGAREVFEALVWLWFTWVASVAAHELGHALGARLTGLRPVAVTVGAGPSVLCRRLGSVVIDVGLIPGTGMTYIRDPRTDHRRWAWAVAFALGPLVSLALLGGFVALSADWAAFRAGALPGVSFGVAAVLSNGALFCASALPLSFSLRESAPPNDLARLFRLFGRQRAAEFDPSLTTFGDAASMLGLLTLRQYQAALEEGRRVLASKPASSAVRLQLANLLITAGCYRQARAELELLRKEPAMQREELAWAAAIVANNYAWTTFLLEEDAHALRAAELASREALSRYPDNPGFLGTRGALLVARGELPQGRQLLHRALRRQRDPHARALSCACLALAAAEEGNVRDAEVLLERALELDPEVELRARVERVLARARHLRNAAAEPNFSRSGAA